eukprot:SAG11_NODE_404_length_9736_cov_20.243022_8_plen_69_part_00
MVKSRQSKRARIELQQALNREKEEGCQGNWADAVTLAELEGKRPKSADVCALALQQLSVITLLASGLA